MYTSLSACKAELKIDTLVTTDDSLLTGYITTAQRLIEASRPLGTGRVFEAAADTTRYLDAPRDTSDRSLDGPLYLLLVHPYGDLCSITSIVNGNGVTVTSGDYVTEPRTSGPFWGIRLKQGNSLIWTWDTAPEAAISITGKWAYSTTAPVDIQRAALRLVVWLYRSRDNADFDHDIKTEDGLIVLGSKMPRDIRLILETYWTVV